MKTIKPERRVGLARAISKLGYCSRSQAFELIRAGRVQRNGTTLRDPESPVALEKDRITIDGKPLRAAKKVCLMLNKPRGLVTTASDEKGRETVYGCLPPGLPWVAPVGRLDQASEGLLLLTNDSEWAARITDPASQVEKRYHVRIAAAVDDALLGRMRAGVESEGERLAVKRVTILRRGRSKAWLEVVLDEGRSRQIRRIMGALGIEIVRLIRVAIGTLELGELQKGKVRRLTREEIQALRECGGRAEAQRPSTRTRQRQPRPRSG